MTNEDKQFLKQVFSNPQFYRLTQEILDEVKAAKVTYMRDCVRSGNFTEAARAEASACACEDFLLAVKARLEQPDQQ